MRVWKNREKQLVSYRVLGGTGKRPKESWSDCLAYWNLDSQSNEKKRSTLIIRVQEDAHAQTQGSTRRRDMQWLVVR